MTGMRHMDHVERVALEDVAELRRKEATYRGSWKRRGGVGAFMMLARKWDRLEGMMERASYDVFGVIESEVQDCPSRIGSDGTALAEIRDLRRYLLLVEAEMIARGVVRLLNEEEQRAGETLSAAEQRAVEALRAAGAAVGVVGHAVMGTTPAKVSPSSSATKRTKREAEAAYRAVGVDPDPKNRNLDGSDHHLMNAIDERLVREAQVRDAAALVRDQKTQWRTQRRRVEDGLIAGDAEDAWWPMIQIPGTPHLNANRAAMPREECEHLKRLHAEQNFKEWSELPAEYQGMYEWRESDLKWILCPEYREHWGRT